jgi:hypothetical protein
VSGRRALVGEELDEGVEICGAVVSSHFQGLTHSTLDTVEGRRREGQLLDVSR